MKITELQNIISNSAFNKQKYTVNIPVKTFIKSLLDYISDDEDIGNSFESILKFGVPGFQRDNQKWSEKMKISFVQNVVKGLVPTIQIFVLEEDYAKRNFVSCKILDGLQRTTAISEFIEGKFKIFNDEISFEDIKDNILRGMSKTVQLELFRFDSESDAIDFYIEMNENITHSQEDIQKALEYKKTLKGN